LYDLTTFDVTKEEDYQLQYFAYKSPPIASDRDFLQAMNFWHDFPEPGMMTMSAKSIEDPRMPVQKKKVRGHVYMQILICKPLPPSNGEERTEAILISNLDIKGLVPKWIVNLTTKTAPS
jgi:hypothetical protein